VALLQVAPAAQFVSNVLGHVFRPTLCGVEGDDHGTTVLALKRYRRIQVCIFAIWLSERATQRAEIVLDKIYPV
jgi:hypothetical protein